MTDITKQLADALRHIENASTDLRFQRYEIRAAATEALAAYAAAQSAPSEQAQQEVASLSEASEAMQEAVAWLMERGYVEMAEDPSGQYVNVLRRPGEDDDEDMEP